MGKKRRSKQKQEDRERRGHDWRRSAGLLKHAEGDGDDFKCPRDGDCFRIWFAIRPWHFGLSVTVRTIPHIMFHAAAAKCSMTLPLGHAHRALIVAPPVTARQNSIGCSAAVSFSTCSPKLAQGHQLSCSQGLSSNQYPVLLNFCKCQSGGFYTEKKKLADTKRHKSYIPYSFSVCRPRPRGLRLALSRS